MSIVVDSDTVGAGVQISQTAKRRYKDYRDAEREISQAQNQSQQIHLNWMQLDQLPPEKKERFGPAQELLKDVLAAVPKNSGSGGRRRYLKWAFGRKSNFESAITQSIRAESSLTLTVLLALHQDL